MNISELLDNWHDIRLQRKVAALREVVNYFDASEGTDDEVILEELFQNLCEWEDNDYFGTEGLQI